MKKEPGIGSPERLDAEFPLSVAKFFILSTTVLQKIAIPGTGGLVWLLEPIFLSLLLYCLLRQVLSIRIYVFCASSLFLFQVSISGFWSSDRASIPSVVLVLFFSTFYLFSFKQVGPNFFKNISQFYIKMMIALAIAGTAQFFGQFIFPRPIVFFIDYLPSDFIVANYNNLNVLYFGSEIIKSNGVVFQEPSTYNQFLALALVAELSFRTRPFVLLTLVIGLGVTFSGTGLLALLPAFPFLAIRRPAIVFTIAGFGIIGLSTLILSTEWLDIYIQRLGEFAEPGTSGYARFVSGFVMLNDYLFEQDIPSALFGHGPGSVREYSMRYTYEVFSPTLIRMILDYGILGGGFYVMLMTYIIFSGPGTAAFNVALWTIFMWMGENSLTPVIHGLVLPMAAWPAIKSSVPASDVTDRA
ncbi:hypothetical protein FOHLNKBM_6235 [Methylobacterium longum]|nr:hypothetical protein FOHLNKBM_6235 [Methylobacterium longum]